MHLEELLGVLCRRCYRAPWRSFWNIQHWRGGVEASPGATRLQERDGQERDERSSLDGEHRAYKSLIVVRHEDASGVVCAHPALRSFWAVLAGRSITKVVP